MATTRRTPTDRRELSLIKDAVDGDVAAANALLDHLRDQGEDILAEGLVSQTVWDIGTPEWCHCIGTYLRGQRRATPFYRTLLGIDLAKVYSILWEPAVVTFAGQADMTRHVFRLHGLSAAAITYVRYECRIHLPPIWVRTPELMGEHWRTAHVDVRARNTLINRILAAGLPDLRTRSDEGVEGPATWEIRS